MKEPSRLTSGTRNATWQLHSLIVVVRHEPPFRVPKQNRAEYWLQMICIRDCGSAGKVVSSEAEFHGSNPFIG